MKKIFSIFISLTILFNTYSCAFAENLLPSTANNKFGIHITSEKDLQSAANLINSDGGDWGYVTIVINESERDHNRWQDVLDQMRSLHLIPIVRIATKADGDSWEIPQEPEINNWIAFLNNLNWVVKNRYVIIGNEPNHASEWGGKIDPAGYSNYLYEFAQKLHQASPDFFVLPAGLDASAANTKNTMDEARFLRGMLAAQPKLFDQLDGWTSHSYPNPDFSGKDTDTGRGTIDTFDWELNYLKSLGVTKNLPVFITETGWSNINIDPEKIGSMYEYAFRNVWNDSRVIAVTPFILDYPQPPFSQFSWEKSDGSFYPYYSAFQKIPKVAGDPTQIESGQIVAAFAQPVIPLGSDFVGFILAKNTGQSIWDTKNIKIANDLGENFIKDYPFNDLEPGKLGLMFFKAETPYSTGIYSRSLFLRGSKGQRITNSFLIEAAVVKLDQTKISEFFRSFLGSLNLSNFIK